MEKQKTIYMVWTPDTDQLEGGYWNQYDSLMEAVEAHADPVEVYEAPLKLLGEYTSKVVVQKIRNKKAKK